MGHILCCCALKVRSQEFLLRLSPSSWIKNDGSEEGGGKEEGAEFVGERLCGSAQSLPPCSP